MVAGLRSDIDYQSVCNIFKSNSVEEIKSAASAFLEAADEVRETFNGMFVYALCQRLAETYTEWSKQYLAPAKGTAWNAVIISPEDSPIMLMSSCVPFGSAPVDVIAGLKKFVESCDEFIPPAKAGGFRPGTLKIKEKQ